MPSVSDTATAADPDWMSDTYVEEGDIQLALTLDQSLKLDLVTLQICKVFDMRETLIMMLNPDDATHHTYRAPFELPCYRDQSIFQMLLSIWENFSYLRSLAPGGQRLVNFIDFVWALSGRLQLIIDAFEHIVHDEPGGNPDYYSHFASDVLATDICFLRATMVETQRQEDGFPNWA